MTDTKQLTITEFLLARIAEDEAVANLPHSWARWHAPGCGVNADSPWNDCDCSARTRVLAACEAKRRIAGRIIDGCPHGIAAGTPERPNRRVHPGGWCLDCGYLLRDLAAIYATHPDYRSEWAA